MFELVQLGRLRSHVGGTGAFESLPEAIRAAREQAIGEPMSVVEIRDNGAPVCTVGQCWMSRRINIRRARLEA